MSLLHTLMLSARCIPRKKGCSDQALPPEWSLPWVFNAVCEMYSRPHEFLFAIIANTKQPMYVSLVSGPMAWNQDTFQLSRVNFGAHAFLPFAVLRPQTDLAKSDAIGKSLLGPGSSSLASEAVVHRSANTSGGKTSKTPFAVVSSGPVSCQGVSLGSEMLQLHVWMLSSVSSTSLAY